MNGNDVLMGRSPRARRRRTIKRLSACVVGSISACAEETKDAAAHSGGARVDLRVRGGDHLGPLRFHRVQGRSPRARRRLRPSVADKRSRGSISACAEETVASQVQRPLRWVDLRVRGGDRGWERFLARHGGRSPRARRRLVGFALHDQWPGSISACAEETRQSLNRLISTEVDLRVRGGDERLAGVGHGGTGRSPRARRRRYHYLHGILYEGSISACAEETRQCTTRTAA